MAGSADTGRFPAAVLESVSDTVFRWLQASSPGGGVAPWGRREWDAARWIIKVHGMAPLLYQRLSPAPQWRKLAPSLKDYLAAQYELNRQRLNVLLGALDAILTSAGHAGIPLMVLKGPVLATQYYEDSALRPMADLDLLVRPQSGERLGHLLGELGYQEMVFNPPHPRHRRFIPVNRAYRVVSPEGEHPDNPYQVEVHTEVREEFWGIGYQVTEELWRDCRLVQVGRSSALVPQPLALLQHLLIHAAMNMILGHLRFLQLYDIHLVARDLSADDWRGLRRAGRRRGEERWLYAPLIMTERYLGAVAPGEVMALLAQGTPPRLRAFLAGAPLWRLSYCHCLPRSLKEKLAWHRSGRELWLALRHMVLPPLDDPGLLGLLSKDLHPVLAYLSLYWHKVFWVLCRLLRLPLIYRVRSWK
jgi:hypothetical protein